MVNKTINSLPHDDFAEKAVIGLLLFDNSYLNAVIKHLNSEDFYSQAHRVITAAILKLINNNKAADNITVSEFLNSENKLKIAGGIEYLESLVDSVPKNINIEDYVESIKNKSTLRRIISTSTKTIEDSQVPQAETKSVLTKLQENLIKISEKNVRNDFLPSDVTVPETLKKIESFQKDGMTSGIKTTFYDLDKITGGFQKSDLIIIAARPSMGKTALALNCALNIAINRSKIAFFSIEMSYHQLICRLLALRSNIDLQTLITGYRKLSKHEWTRLELAASELTQTSFFIDDSPALSVIDFKTRARRLHEENGLDVIFVDYLQLIRTSDVNKGTFDSRSREVAFISASLKEIAKELDIPVVAMAQLNRSPEQRGGKGDQVPRYQLSDLKESGAIEQDADIIMFLHREEQVNKETERTGEADLIISKHRNGPTGIVKLAFISKYTKFANYGENIPSINPVN